MKLFLAEDDPIIQEGLRLALGSEGFELTAASSVAEAMPLLHDDYDICILDVMLPDGTGYDICAEIRKNSDVPIIFLTACDDELHTVLALEQGADDYIAKPFRMRELLARIKAILRRTSKKPEAAETAQVGSCTVNIRTGKVFRDGAEIVLTAMEYKLLLIFLNNRGAVLSRQQILHNIWDVAGDYVTDNTLTVYVKRLREKLEAGDEVIQTVRGLGYRLV
jgi:DNA-binding response OmpR family regulator